jgi:peptidoglycan hydrolase-like protein with peptidoglycan-binding domain
LDRSDPERFPAYPPSGQGGIIGHTSTKLRITAVACEVHGEQLVLLVVGFLLTGGLGAWLTHRFQARAWDHQHEVEQRDQERQQALRTFEEVSTRLDKQQYRTRRLYREARKMARGTGSTADLDDARAAYDEAVVDYYANFHRTMALVQTYFGPGLKEKLEYIIYQRFETLRRHLNTMVTIVSENNEHVKVPRLDRSIDELSGDIYKLNVDMLNLLEEDRLGRRAPPAPQVEASPPTEEPTLRTGDQGKHVLRLQRALNRTGEVSLSVDGTLGEETSTAVRSFQRSHNLPADGIVGQKTWAALPMAPPTLQMGDQGEHVRRIQQALNRTGEVPIDVDGIYGQGTWAAVRSFQRLHNLDADGIVGPKTWAALFEEERQ